MITFTAREMSGGTGHEHIIRLWWSDQTTGQNGDMDIGTATQWLDKPANRAYVKDQMFPGQYVEAFVVKPQYGHWYIRTHANGRWTDNFLALPTRRKAA